MGLRFLLALSLVLFRKCRFEGIFAMGYAKYSEDINDRLTEDFFEIDIGTEQSKPPCQGQPTDAQHLDDQPQSKGDSKTRSDSSGHC